MNQLLQTTKQKRNPRKIVVALLCPALIISTSLLLSGCNNADAVNNSETVEEIVTIPVEATQTKIGDISSNYTTTTTLEPKIEAEVISKAAGIIEHLYVEEGQYVEEGELLASIEQDRFQLNLAKARAELSGIKHELARIDKVHSQKLVSTDTYDKLKWQYEAAKSTLAIAELDLKETKIVAPISGYIAKRYVKEGNLVEQFARQKLFHIVQQETLQGIVHLPEQELNKLAVDQSASLALTALPNEKIHAVVERISPIVDADTGTFRVTLAISNKSNKLKSGMFAQVKINYDTHKQTQLLAKKALISMDNQHIVYTVEDNATGQAVATKTLLTLGYQDDDYVEVLSGLSVQDTVVITGQHNLKDQAPVEVIESL